MSKFVATERKATRADIGEPVLVYQAVGEPPISAVIASIDETTGLIIQVIVKDQNKEDKILAVKTKVVLFLEKLPGFIEFLINVWKTFFSKKKE